MITRLDKASARKISAGQVITDLSSVVKELLENALDAGAQSVTIRLHRFGLDRIVVDDDGSGIPMSGVVDVATGQLQCDAATPLLRSRATTKRQGADAADDAASAELGACDGQSLGFRGEALHSLAQMADVTVETQHAATTGACTVCVAYNRARHAVELDVSRARQAPGTTVTVRNLFADLPVRLKEYTKGQRRQLLAATQTVRQYALSHPRLRLVVTHQETPQSAVVSVVSMTGSNDLRRSLMEAYGGMCLSHMMPVEWQCSFGTLSGFVSKVDGGGRMSADRQVFSLDGRIVDLPRIAAAINDAFAECLPNAHQRQSVAFFLRVEVGDVVEYDVNLTPNKRKVILGGEEALAGEVRAAALSEFQAASEGIQVERRQQNPSQPVWSRTGHGSGQHGAARDHVKEVLMPVSKTAFTDYTFRPSAGTRAAAGGETPEKGEAAASSSQLSFEKLGAVLYSPGHALEGDGDGEGGPSSSSSQQQEHSSASWSATSSDSDSDSDGDGSGSGEALFESGDESGDAADAEMPAKRVRVEGGDSGGEEGEAPPPVSVVSDAANQRRGEGAVAAVAFPAWDRLAGAEYERCCTWGGEHPEDTASATAAGGPSHGFSSFLQQSGRELTAFFHKRSFKEMVVLGQFNHGFIIAALGDDLFVVDQHASDEKYNYERLMRQYTATPQPLVQPIPVPMDAEEVELAVAHAQDLVKHGFQVRRGADPTKLLVSSVPVLPYDVVSASDVLELVQQLVRYGRLTKQLRAVWHSMATKACRSSIMIGTALSDATMRTVVGRLAELDQPWTCPHGRPTLRHLGSTSAFLMHKTQSLQDLGL